MEDDQHFLSPRIVGVLFALPVMICLLFGVAVGGAPKALHLAVVNDDYPCDDGLPAFPRDCDREDPSGLSCRYLRRLSTSMFVQVAYRPGLPRPLNDMFITPFF